MARVRIATAADREREERAREEHAAKVAQWDAEAAWRKAEALRNVEKWAGRRRATR